MAYTARLVMATVNASSSGIAHAAAIAGMRHRGNPAGGGNRLVLMPELGHVPLVQVEFACRLRAGGDKRKSDGGGKGTRTTVEIHWRFP